MTRRGPSQPGDLDRSPRQPAAEPHHATQVSERGGHHVDPRVEVIDPVDRDLVDAQPGPLGQHQQFGVEEPAGVLGKWQQRPRLPAPDRLEPALGVREPGPHAGVQQQVVAPGDELALGSADHPRPPGQPGADGHVAVAGQQRRDQRQQRVQIRRQIDIHVREDLGVTLRPDRPQRPPPSRLFHAYGPHLIEVARQPVGDGPGAVRAAVVRDGDPRGKREALPQIADQPPHARREITFLVTHRNHNVHLHNSHSHENRRPCSAVAEAILCTRYEQRNDPVCRTVAPGTDKWLLPLTGNIAASRLWGHGLD